MWRWILVTLLNDIDGRDDPLLGVVVVAPLPLRYCTFIVDSCCLLLLLPGAQ